MSQDNINNQQDDPISDPLDAVLLSEFNSAEQLRPSSGFVLSVMDAVHEEAIGLPPIPFPWKRILPGAIATLCALVAFVIWTALHPGPSVTDNFNLTLPTFTGVDSAFCWITVALALTLVAVSSSFWMANRRSR